MQQNFLLKNGIFIENFKINVCIIRGFHILSVVCQISLYMYLIEVVPVVVSSGREARALVGHVVQSLDAASI